MSPKWPILCQLVRETWTQSIPLFRLFPAIVCVIDEIPLLGTFLGYLLDFGWMTITFTQPCIPPGSINWVPGACFRLGVDGDSHLYWVTGNTVISYSMWVSHIGEAKLLLTAIQCFLCFTCMTVCWHIFDKCFWHSYHLWNICRR